MTNSDDFTRAASAAAEEQWTREHTPGHPLSGPERMNRRIGFTMGAEWARAYLTEQEPTDAEVEAAVLGELAHLQGYDLAGEEDRVEVLAWWAGMDEEVRASRLDTARAALIAARRDEETQDG